jgi:hypothetical protein
MKPASQISRLEGHAGPPPGGAAGAVTSIAGSVYRLLLRLYPPAFRRQFAVEMACDFDDATCEAWREGRWLEVVSLWLRLAHDLALTLIIQWLRQGFLAIPVLSALGATMFVFAVASMLVRPVPPSVAITGNDGLTLLLFLATIVILIAAAVITFTVCFWLLMVRRTARARRV